MSTWLDHWDQRYTDRVRLLVDILPVLAQEPRFALKGGTAINLFERDLPRLSVDIDLAPRESKYLSFKYLTFICYSDILFLFECQIST